MLATRAVVDTIYHAVMGVLTPQVTRKLEPTDALAADIEKGKIQGRRFRRRAKILTRRLQGFKIALPTLHTRRYLLFAEFMGNPRGKPYTPPVTREIAYRLLSDKTMPWLFATSSAGTAAAAKQMVDALLA